MNANQLAGALDLNYKTVQHHLELLTENDVLMTMGDSYGATYFLTDAMESNLDVLDEVAEKADMDDLDAATQPDGTADTVGVDGDGTADRDGTNPTDEATATSTEEDDS